MQETLAAQCLIVLALAITLIRLARTLPWQNVIASAALISILAGIFEGAKTGFSSVRFSYTENFGHLLFHKVPWPMPLLWVVILLNARDVARMILRNRRGTENYGIWVIALASLLAVSLDVGLEPFANANHWWISSGNGGLWHGASFINFVGWAVVAFFILVTASPWLINKKVSSQSSFDWFPASVWAALILLLFLANVWHGYWAAATFALAVQVIIPFAAWWLARKIG
jgi:uncharacterized membrane protein